MILTDRTKLTDLIAEYGHGLARVQAERELLKAIEQRALTELEQPPKAFKAVATAIWRDEVQAARDALDAQIDLFDWVRDAPAEARPAATVEIRRVAA